MRTLNAILDDIICTLRNTVQVYNGSENKFNTVPVTDALAALDMRELGQGHFSIVFSCPQYNHLAVKVGLGADHSGQPLTDDWLRFGLYCMQQPASWLPEIHRLHVDDTFYVAVLERYKTYSGCATDRQEAWRDAFCNGIYQHRANWSRRQDDNYFYDPYLREAYSAGRKLREAFRDAETDLHSGNFMLGEDGRVICTDPFSFGHRSKEELIKTLQHSSVKEITCSVTVSGSRRKTANITSNSAVRGPLSMMAKSPLGEMRYMVRAIQNDLALFGRAVVHVNKTGTKTKHRRVCNWMQQAATRLAACYAPRRVTLLRLVQPVRHNKPAPVRFMPKHGLHVDVPRTRIQGAADLQKWANVDFAHIEARLLAHAFPRIAHDQFIETRPFQGFLARHGKEPSNRPVSAGPVLRSG